MNIILVGEDIVCREIQKRLLYHSGRGFNIIREEPVRGGEIKNKILGYNNLGLPVFTLTDLDAEDCPPSLINKWFGEYIVSQTHLFRVAYSEAESWLMSDKVGFSKFLGINQNILPGTINLDIQNPQNIELLFPYKPSLYLMRHLLASSNNPKLISQLSPKNGAKKGPEYNSALIPFIRDEWSIDSAINNSYSLRKTIQRIQEFNPHGK